MENYEQIFRHYEATLEKHGANFKGMDWPEKDQLNSRFEIMLDVVRKDQEGKSSLLDLGCGVGLLIDYLRENQRLTDFDYNGMDISDKMIQGAKSIHPDFNFRAQDILTSPLPDESFDYIIMNGVMTEKLTLSQEEMVGFAQKIISAAFKACKKGIAFNVMSSHVDWKRDDLFHWELDNCASFLVRECSRHLKFNMDYGLYEYTVHVYKQANN